MTENSNFDQFCIHYSDRSKLQHSEHRGTAGFTDDTITEKISYIDGTKEEITYTTSGSNSIFGRQTRTPYGYTKTNRDGTTEIGTYEYLIFSGNKDGVDHIVEKKWIYSEEGYFIGREVIEYGETENALHGFGGLDPNHKVFTGYQEFSRKIYDEDDRLIREEISYPSWSWEPSKTGYGKTMVGSRYSGYTKAQTCIYGYDDNGIVSFKVYDADGNLYQSYVAKEMMFDGKIYSFNANELKSITASLDASKSILSGNLSAIADVCNSIAGMISGSGDSGLSGNLSKIGETCSDAKLSVDKHFTNLSSEITNYIIKTIKNEEERTQELQEIESSLDDISNYFDSVI